jgi:hypothetical protein
MQRAIDKDPKMLYASEIFHHRSALHIAAAGLALLEGKKNEKGKVGVSGGVSAQRSASTRGRLYPRLAFIFIFGGSEGVEFTCMFIVIEHPDFDLVRYFQ